MLKYAVIMGALVALIWFSVCWIIAATKRDGSNPKILLVLALTAVYVFFVAAVAILLASAATK